MIGNFDKALALVLKSEGGYVWDKRDPGGETNLGVTKAAWSNYLKRPIEDGEMAKLTVADVTPFYKAMYWNVCNCDGLPIGVDYAVFDFAVNAGCGRSIKTLQKALGTTPDGVLGSISLELIRQANPLALLDEFSQAKTAFYKSLTTYPTFGKGWLSRIASVQTNAENMIG